MPQDFPGSQYQSGYAPSGCLLAKLSYSNELRAEVNQAYSSCTPHSFLVFFLPIGIQHVPQKERMLNIPGVSRYVIQSNRSQPYLSFTAVVPSTGTPEQSIVLQTVRLSQHTNAKPLFFLLCLDSPVPGSRPIQGGGRYVFC